LLRFSFYSRSFCLVLYCMYPCDQSNTHHHVLPYYVCVYVFRRYSFYRCFRVCYCVMYFHVSMCINACPLLSAFPSFIIPRYTHSCVYSRGFSRSPRLYRCLVHQVDEFLPHVGLYFEHFQKWFQSSWLLPHEVHRIVLVIVDIPFRYMALCSMFLNQELVSFFVPILCAMFLPISLHGISVSSFNLFS